MPDSVEEEGTADEALAPELDALGSREHRARVPHELQRHGHEAGEIHNGVADEHEPRQDPRGEHPGARRHRQTRLRAEHAASALSLSGWVRHGGQCGGVCSASRAREDEEISDVPSPKAWWTRNTRAEAASEVGKSRAWTSQSGRDK